MTNSSQMQLVRCRLCGCEMKRSSWYRHRRDKHGNLGGMVVLSQSPSQRDAARPSTVNPSQRDVVRCSYCKTTMNRSSFYRHRASNCPGANFTVIYETEKRHWARGRPLRSQLTESPASPSSASSSIPSPLEDRNSESDDEVFIVVDENEGISPPVRHALSDRGDDS